MAEIGNNIATGQLVNANDFVTLDIADDNYASIQITNPPDGTTWSGTISFTVSNDGKTFVALLMTPSTVATQASSATANGAWNVLIGGYRVLRAQFTTATSGKPIVILSAA